MDALYKSLEHCSIDVLDQQQILKLCEFICDNYSLPTSAAGPYVYPSPSSETTTAAEYEHRASYEVSLASRILIQLVICAKGDVAATKFIKKVYVRIVTSTCVEMEEFISLGQMIVTMHDIHDRYSAKCFHNCSIDLPFQDLSCRPRKYSVPLPSVDSLMHLQDFWCDVAAQLYSSSMAPQLQQLLMQSTVDPSCLLPPMMQVLAPIRAGCRSVVRACTALSSSSRYFIDPLYYYNGEVVDRCLSHLLDWTECLLDDCIASLLQAVTSTTCVNCDDIEDALRSIEDAVHSLLGHWNSVNCAEGRGDVSWRGDLIGRHIERILCLVERKINSNRALLAAAPDSHSPLQVSVTPAQPSAKSHSTVIRTIAVHLMHVLSFLFLAQHMNIASEEKSTSLRMCHCLVRMPFTVDSADAVMNTILVTVRPNISTQSDEENKAFLLHVTSEAQQLVERLQHEQVADSKKFVDKAGIPILQPRLTALLDVLMRVRVHSLTRLHSTR